MANIAAAQNGDFSATATWTGGVVPGSGDVAYANTFTVTISDTRTVQAISNAAGTGITVGGTFSLLNNCNLTCTNANGVVQGNTTTSCVTTSSLTLGNTATVAASFTNTTTTTGGHAINFSTAGTLNWTGNIATSATVVSHGVNVTGTGIFNQTGSLTGGTANGAYALNITGNATVSITGNVTSGTGNASYGINMTNGSVTVNGNVTGANTGTGAAINNFGSTTLTVNGTCQSGNTGATAIAQGSNTQITRLSGPFLLGASGINPVQAASWRWAPTQIPTYMEVPTSGGTTKRNLYTADNMPSGGYPTAANVRSGTVYGPNSENTGTLAVPAVGSVALGVAVDNTVGTAILTAASVRTAVGLASANLDAQLATAAADSSGTTTLLARLTSTRAANLDYLDAAVSSLPSAAAIATAVWGAVSRTLTTTIPTASDVASAVWNAVTRTVTGGTVDTASNVPSASTVASAVWSAASRTLTTAIDNSSTIAAAVWSAATRTLTSSSAPTAADNAAAVWGYGSGRTITGGTVDTLTNAPTVPSAADIASQVWATADKTGYSLTSAERSAIATTVEQAILNESDGQQILNEIVGAIGNQNVDQVALVAAIRADLERNGGTLATRLAASDYSPAPTTGEIRSELTPELQRMANCATVDSTGLQIRAATSED